MMLRAALALIAFAFLSAAAHADPELKTTSLACPGGAPIAVTYLNNAARSVGLDHDLCAFPLGKGQRHSWVCALGVRGAYSVETFTAGGGNTEDLEAAERALCRRKLPEPEHKHWLCAGGVGFTATIFDGSAVIGLEPDDLSFEGAVARRERGGYVGSVMQNGNRVDGVIYHPYGATAELLGIPGMMFQHCERS